MLNGIVVCLKQLLSMQSMSKGLQNAMLRRVAVNPASSCLGFQRQSPRQARSWQLLCLKVVDGSQNLVQLHMTDDRDAMSEFVAFTCPYPVTFGDGNNGEAVGVGNVIIDTRVGLHQHLLQLCMQLVCSHLTRMYYAAQIQLQSFYHNV